MEGGGIQGDIESGIQEVDDITDGDVAVHTVVVVPGCIDIFQTEIGDHTVYSVS